jgi:Trk K+ transport system NAD-binding subunit
MAAKLDEAGIPFTVIDVHPERVSLWSDSLLGRGTEAVTLEEARVRDAVGIIAGTGDDMDNLSIVMTARELNPRLFLVARQENPQNDELFEASGADLVARRSLILARRILMLATTPLLPVFIDHMIHHDETFANTVKHRLDSVLDGRSPGLWTMHLTGPWAQSLREAKSEHVPVRMEHLTQNARTPSYESLPCICLLLQRGSSRIFLPGPEQALIEGDTLLFAGRGGARDEMLFALSEPTALVSVASGRPQPRGAIMRRLVRKRVDAERRS